MKQKPFRIGPGYIAYWVHEAGAHWELSSRERVALQDLDESFRRLLRQRDAVQHARRAFLPASSLHTEGPPSPATQQALYDAVHDFFQTFYSTLSALASFLGRFRTELESEVPHRSNAKFLDWLTRRALFKEEALPLLQEARQFRALLDHKASHQPADWGTQSVDGFVRIFLHGPAGSTGALPDGAMMKLPEMDMLPEEHDWQFVAPDEDLVLWALAVQMNATFPRIQPWRWDQHRVDTCRWKLVLAEGDPQEGYPTFFQTAGRVVYSGPAGKAPRYPRLTKTGPPLSDKEIVELLSKYLDGDQTA